MYYAKAWKMNKLLSAVQHFSVSMVVLQLTKTRRNSDGHIWYDFWKLQNFIGSRETKGIKWKTLFYQKARLFMPMVIYILVLRSKQLNIFLL